VKLNPGFMPTVYALPVLYWFRSFVKFEWTAPMNARFMSIGCHRASAGDLVTRNGSPLQYLSTLIPCKREIHGPYVRCALALCSAIPSACWCIPALVCLRVLPPFGTAHGQYQHAVHLIGERSQHFQPALVMGALVAARRWQHCRLRPTRGHRN
jgi:hypothetical protein